MAEAIITLRHPISGNQNGRLSMALDHREQIESLKQKLPPGTRMLVRREFKKLPELLEEDELLQHCAQGRYRKKQGLVVATDRRVMFIEEGVVRSNLEDFRFENITSVQSGKKLAFGKLMIYVAGNAAEIDNIVPKNMGIALGDYVRQQMGTISQVAAQPAASESSLDKLKKLGELKEAGVISEEEFNDQKAKLLESI